MKHHLVGYLEEESTNTGVLNKTGTKITRSKNVSPPERGQVRADTAVGDIWRCRDEYRDKGRRWSRSRSRDRSSREYRGRDRDYHHRSRNRSLSPDYRKDRERSRYDDARRSRSRSRGSGIPHSFKLAKMLPSGLRR
ncbi:hypothetical protein ACET3Z_024718 [Daucus carota]